MWEWPLGRSRLCMPVSGFGFRVEGVWLLSEMLAVVRSAQAGTRRWRVIAPEAETVYRKVSRNGYAVSHWTVALPASSSAVAVLGLSSRCANPLPFLAQEFAVNFGQP